MQFNIVHLWAALALVTISAGVGWAATHNSEDDEVHREPFTHYECYDKQGKPYGRPGDVKEPGSATEDIYWIQDMSMGYMEDESGARYPTTGRMSESEFRDSGLDPDTIVAVCHPPRVVYEECLPELEARGSCVK